MPRRGDTLIGPDLTKTFPDSSSFPSTARDLREAAHLAGLAAMARAEVEDRDGGFPSRDIEALHEAGLLLAPFPTNMGGHALGSTASTSETLMEVLVSIGAGSLSLGRLYEGHVNAIRLVSLYGDGDALDLMREEAAAGFPSGVWMAEDGSPLRLTRKADRLVLDGRKILASGCGHFRRPLVAALSDEGSVMVIPFIADLARADASAWTTQGMRATATGSVDFTGIEVTRAEIVGKPGDYMRSPFFRGGAWRVIAVQLGGLEAMMALYKAQAAASRNASDPLALARFGEALIATQTARLWVTEACRRAESGVDEPAAIDAYVDLARNAFEHAALRAVGLAQKSVGLRAYLRPNPMERVIRDLTTYMRQPALDASLTSAASFHLTRTRDGI